MSEKPISYVDFVKLVIDALESSGVEYLIGGAVATWGWGEPRSTLDLDLVVDIPLEVVGRLSSELNRRGMLVPAEIILDAIIEERADIPINAIHSRSGFKADLYLVCPGDELRRSAFQRRKRVDLGPELGEVYLHSPEDLIIYKLWYFNISRQTKHIRDITAILQTLGDKIDFGYLNYWIDRKGLISPWKELLDRIQSQNLEKDDFTHTSGT
jgi:hypothetical protein